MNCQALNKPCECESHCSKPESNDKIKVICEAGLNWRNFNEAIDYVVKAKEIGADIIKFQITDIDKTWKKNNKKYNDKIVEIYKNVDIKGYIKSIEMTDREWYLIKKFCDDLGIQFMATPSSIKKIRLLRDMGVKVLKIGSDRAIQKDFKVWYKKFDEVLMSDGLYQTELTNMYCVSLYPCDRKYISFTTMGNDRYIGFSDHTLEYDKAWCDKIRSRENIRYVEKHFKLDNKCIDNHVSLGYNEMREFINNIRSE